MKKGPTRHNSARKKKSGRSGRDNIIHYALLKWGAAVLRPYEGKRDPRPR